MQRLLMRSPVAVAAFWIAVYLAIALLPLFYLIPIPSSHGWTKLLDRVFSGFGVCGVSHVSPSVCAYRPNQSD